MRFFLTSFLIFFAATNALGENYQFKSSEIVCAASLGENIHGMRTLSQFPAIVEQKSSKIRVVKFHNVNFSHDDLLRRSQEVEIKNNDLGKRVFCSPNYIYKLNREPNDTRWSQLWGMSKIKAPQAWDNSTGSTQILVGVVDTGILTTHSDLSGNIAVNSSEIPNNSLDDDSNGYVDDVYGYNFVSGNSDVTDDHGHGTHVSGTIGAVGNNNNGVAGVNWTTRLVTTKTLDENGEGTLDGIALAIHYLRLRGVKAMNLSLGGPASSVMFNALLAASNAGIFLAFAAGNGGEDGIGDNNDSVGTISYPAKYSFATSLTVAATNTTDTLGSFSNYGATTVHLAAPGVDIVSTLNTGGYAIASGTSMSAPHVTGGAALLKAMNGSLSGSSIRSCLLSSVDSISSLSGKVSSGGRLNLQVASQICGSANSATPTPTPIGSITPPPTNTPGNGGAAPTPDMPTPIPLLISPTISFKQKSKSSIEISGNLFVSQNGGGISGTEVERACKFACSKRKVNFKITKRSISVDGQIRIRDRVSNSKFLALRVKDPVQITCNFTNALASEAKVKGSIRWKR